MTIIFSTIGILLIINAILVQMMSNFNLAIIVQIVLGVSIMLYGIFWKFIKKIMWLNIVISMFAIVSLSTSIFLAIFGNNDNVTYSDEDCIIVLGAGIHGEEVSLALARRLDKAVELHNAMPTLKIIVTGGQGAGEYIPESEAMERYLVARGVPEEAILQENQATSTMQNLQLSRVIMQNNGLNKAVIITNTFHVYRANHLAIIAGIDNARHLGAKTEWYIVPMNYIRETIAVWKMWLIPMN